MSKHCTNNTNTGEHNLSHGSVEAPGVREPELDLGNMVAGTNVDEQVDVPLNQSAKKGPPYPYHAWSTLSGSFGFSNDQAGQIIEAAASYNDGSVASSEIARHRQANIGRSLLNLEVLKGRDSQAPITLYNRYGILNFHRYPPELLLRQLAEAESPPDDRDVQILVSAHSDDNDFAAALVKIFHSETGIRTIFAEAGSIGGVGRVLLNTANPRNPNGCRGLRRLAIFGHGDPKEGILMGLSGGGSRSCVSASDIQESVAVGRLVEKGILAPDADILLISCSVGVAGGPAEVLSYKLPGLNIVASSQVASVSFIGANKTRSMRFDARSGRRGIGKRIGGLLLGMRNDPVTVVYRNGRPNLVEKYPISLRQPDGGYRISGSK